MSDAVVSLGSINVDFVATVDDDDLAAFDARYDWFPAPGETVNVDHVPDAFDRLPVEIHLGGKGANQAAAAGRAGADAALFGRVGQDEEEYDIRDALSDAGVDTAGIERTDGPTGRAYVLVDETGESYVVSVSGANDRLDEAYVRDRYDDIGDAAVLLLQNELPVAPVDWLLSRLDDRPERPTVILDPAPAAGADRLVAHRCVDYATPNDGEYRALRDAFDRFAGTVVRTRGADDVVVDGRRTFSVSPPAVDPVDATGAGDTFNGYLAARLAAGDAVEEAVAVATVAASMSVRSEGAQSSIPDLGAVRGFRAERA